MDILDRLIGDPAVAIYYKPDSDRYVKNLVVEVVGLLAKNEKRFVPMVRAIAEACGEDDDLETDLYAILDKLQR